MNDSRKLATHAMKVIDEHYPEFLKDCGVEDNTVGEIAYYTAVLATVREDPLPDEAAESILEAKLSKKLFHLRNRMRQDIRKVVADERKRQAAQN